MAQATPRPAKDYLAPETLAQVSNIELRARHIVEGLMTGMHRSPYYGYSVEFAQHRPYTVGDDLRHLDWKVFGRSDKLYLKQYQQETNLDLMLLVDGSGSMAYGSGLGGKAGVPWRKYDHATAICAALSYLALRQQDRPGLILFADKILASVRPSATRPQWHALIHALSTQPVDRPTNMARLFEEVLPKLRHRSMVVIISDFFEDPQVLADGLARLHHRRHDVMLLQTLDHQELTFTFRNPRRLLGLEGEGLLDLDPNALREAYLDQMRQHVQAVRSQGRRFRYDHEVLDTSASLGPILSRFLARRTSRLWKA